MAFNPAGTKWSVAPIDNNGAIGGFHPTPWEFNRQSMNAGTHWAGGYSPIPGSDIGFVCEIIGGGSTDPGDNFEVYFVTPDRFFATKNGALYRFGKKV